MSFIRALKDYLDLHKGERMGSVSLVIILFIILIIWALLPYLVKPTLVNHDQLEHEMSLLIAHRDSMLLAQENKTEVYTHHTRDKAKKEKQKPTLFTFDPNTIGSTEWKKLGLNSGQIKTIFKYKEKGGKFFKPSDLAKMYTISEEQYSLLEPYIEIKPLAELNNNHNIEKDLSKDGRTEVINEKEDIPLYLDINRADTLELVKLKGIGPYFARKIVEKRNELGGYHSTTQLLEIWNFSEETLQKIESQIHTGNGTFNKINLNSCSKEELKQHPYISWAQAKAIIAYREQHGPFTDISQISNSHLITEELCQKMKPYLTIEE